MGEDGPVRRLGYAGLVYVGGRGASGYAPGGGTVRRLAHGRVRGARRGRGLFDTICANDCGGLQPGASRSTASSSRPMRM